MPAVAGVLEVRDLGQVDVALVAEEAVVRQGVVGDLVAPVVVVADVFAFEFDFDAALAVGDRRWFFGRGIGDEQDAPRAVVVDVVAADRVVAATGDRAAINYNKSSRIREGVYRERMFMRVRFIYKSNTSAATINKKNGSNFAIKTI